MLRARAGNAPVFGNNLRMERIAIVGSPGSGKTSLARRLAEHLDLRHIELDAIFHQPGWEPLPDDQFIARVTEATAGSRWVTDGNYQRVAGPIIWQRADTVVFLDLPRHTAMRALLGRSARRAWRQEELWNGNRERFRNFVKRDKEENILLWAWTQHRRYRRDYLAAIDAPENAGLNFVHLRTRRQVAAWLAGVGASV